MRFRRRGRVGIRRGRRGYGRVRFKSRRRLGRPGRIGWRL